MATVFRSKNFLLITAANLMFFLGFQMLVPVLPLYVQALGGNDIMAGLVVAMGTVGGLLSRPMAGRLIDRRGRMTLYYIGLAACAAAVALYPFCTVLLLLPLLRGVHGVCMGTYTTTASTIVTDILPRFQLSEGLGYYSAASTLAMAVSPALALALVGIIDFQGVFWIAFAVMLLTLVVSLFLRVPPPSSLGRRQARQSVYERRAMLPAMLLFFETTAYCAPATYLALYAKELGVANIGAFFSVYAGAIILSRVFFGRVADRRGYHAVLLPALALAPVSFIFLVCGTELWMFLIAALLFGLSFGITFPTCQAMAVGDVVPERRGAATATVMSGFDLGFFTGALLWGVTAQYLGYRLMFGANILLLILPPIIYGVWFSGKKRADRA